MGWEHQADFVAALKKAKNGSEKKIHKVAHLAIHHKKWYKHVVKNIREFFGKGFRKGDSRLIVAYVVDAILKADAKSMKPVYAKRFQPWLHDLFGGCRLVAKDHKNLTQLADLWKKFFQADAIAPIMKLLNDTKDQAAIDLEKQSNSVDQSGLKHLASILEENQTKRKMTPVNNGPPQKKRKLNPTPPQVTVQAVGADPRSRAPQIDPRTGAAPQVDPRTGAVPQVDPRTRTVPQIDPRTGTVPQTSSAPIIVRTSVPTQPPSDPRLPPNNQLLTMRQYPPPQAQSLRQYPPQNQYPPAQTLNMRQYPPPQNNQFPPQYPQNFHHQQLQNNLPGYHPSILCKF
jgi:hypothetical protein